MITYNNSLYDTGINQSENIIYNPPSDRNTFKQFINQHKNKLIFVKFYADWCKPCKQLTPVLETMTRQYAGKFHLLKVNID